MRDEAFLYFGLWKGRERLESLLNLLPEKTRERRREKLANLGEMTPEAAREILEQVLEERRQNQRAKLEQRFGKGIRQVDPRVAELLLRLG